MVAIPLCVSKVVLKNILMRSKIKGVEYDCFLVGIRRFVKL